MSITMGTSSQGFHHSHDAHGHAHKECCEHVHIRDQTKGALLDGIIAYCQQHALRLTAMRKLVLEVLLDTHQPLGAYDLLNKVSHIQNKKVAPVTIYRALDFLIQHHFAHKLETLNAYTPCTLAKNHDATACDPSTHHIVFLICDACGGVDEMSSEPVYANIHSLMKRSQFKPRNLVLEFSGTCHHCQA